MVLEEAIPTFQNSLYWFKLMPNFPKAGFYSLNLHRDGFKHVSEIFWSKKCLGNLKNNIYYDWESFRRFFWSYDCFYNYCKIKHMLVNSYKIILSGIAYLKTSIILDSTNFNLDNFMWTPVMHLFDGLDKVYKVVLKW